MERSVKTFTRLEKVGVVLRWSSVPTSPSTVVLFVVRRFVAGIIS
jgi:hypothetical protein